MLKKAIIIGIALFALAFVGTAFAGGMGPATITLDAGGHMGKVHFPHRLHQKTLGQCQVCHKVFAKKANSIQKAIKAGKLQKMQVMNTVCKACHQKRKSEGKTAGPTNCTGCHKR
jgi:hypothetical protein